VKNAQAAEIPTVSEDDSVGTVAAVRMASMHTDTPTPRILRAKRHYPIMPFIFGVCVWFCGKFCGTI
jgi:hypothetical protein